MRKTVLAFLLFVLTFGQVTAQVTEEKEDDWATYYMIDKLDARNNSLELWTLLPDPKEVKTTDKIAKEVFGGKDACDVETYGELWSEFRNEKRPTYRKQVSLENPAHLKPGERTFGYSEERRMPDGRIIQNWPVFHRMEGHDGFYRLTSTAFLPDGSKYVQIKEYGEYEYYFPMRETHVVITFDGSIASHMVYIKREKR